MSPERFEWVAHDGPVRPRCEACGLFRGTWRVGVEGVLLCGPCKAQRAAQGADLPVDLAPGGLIESILKMNSLLEETIRAFDKATPTDSQ